MGCADRRPDSLGKSCMAEIHRRFASASKHTPLASPSPSGRQAAASENPGSKSNQHRNFDCSIMTAHFHSVLGYVHFSDETPASMSGHFAACFETPTSATDTDTPPSYPDSIQQDASVSGEQDFIFDHKSIRTLFDNDPNALRELADLFDETCEETLGFLASGFDSPTRPNSSARPIDSKVQSPTWLQPQILESCQKLEADYRK